MSHSIHLDSSPNFLEHIHPSAIHGIKSERHVREDGKQPAF
jgi:hypothetical protein